LTEEITAKGLSNLNWSADGTAQVYFRLALSVSNLCLFSLTVMSLFYKLLIHTMAISYCFWSLLHW